jgi:hypothetical protein
MPQIDWRCSVVLLLCCPPALLFGKQETKDGTIICTMWTRIIALRLQCCCDPVPVGLKSLLISPETTRPSPCALCDHAIFAWLLMLDAETRMHSIMCPVSNLGLACLVVDAGPRDKKVLIISALCRFCWFRPGIDPATVVHDACVSCYYN